METRKENLRGGGLGLKGLRYLVAISSSLDAARSLDYQLIVARESLMFFGRTNVATGFYTPAGFKNIMGISKGRQKHSVVFMASPLTFLPYKNH